MAFALKDFFPISEFLLSISILAWEEVEEAA